MREIATFDFIVLGGGVAGLSAASVLGNRCTVLEKEGRPGGLVRSENLNGYWFDRVLHLLHFQDVDTEKLVGSILRDELSSCPPEAWVETSAGVTRYPFQMNLGALDPSTVSTCLDELRVISGDKSPDDLEEALLCTFGCSMCELFMLPYNRKLWKRPLNTLEADVSWTVARPAFDDVLRGALFPNGDFRPYNARGWYPRPGPSSTPRGMERLSSALSERVLDIRIRHEVKSIDPISRTVVSICNETGEECLFKYRFGVISTIPLPHAAGMINDIPADKALKAENLSWNRVYSVMLAIRGTRPSSCGHWRYYADENLCFTRLVFMHSFDHFSAPDEGWGLLVEITEPAEFPLADEESLCDRVLCDLEIAGVLPAGSSIIGMKIVINDPAYVAFTHGTSTVKKELSGYLESLDIHPLGRYGRWEYSSMAQVIRDGFELGEKLAVDTADASSRGEQSG